VGDQFEQTLVRIIKQEDGSLEHEEITGCRFVKLIGKHGWEGEE
jgi:protein-L-isoaspartate(D-aspartate) O-methyltransferase